MITLMMASPEKVFLLVKASEAFYYNFPEFNLNIKSEIRLNLPLSDKTPFSEDIEIIKTKNISLPQIKNSKLNCFGDLNNYYYLKENLLLAKIQRGKKIYVQLLKNIDEEIVSNMILNIPLGYCLYQKSKFVMHGSAFKKDNNSVLFLGESGSGKSSLVASLIGSGEVLSEDLCLIDFNEQGDSLISPSLPFIKLEKKMNLALKDKHFRVIDVPFDKRNRSYHYFKDSKLRSKSKIKNIYLLKWGTEFKIYKPDIKELFSFLNLCIFSCFPLNCCTNSSKMLFENITKLSKSTNFFVLERNKEDFFANNSALLEHISDCP